MQVNLDPAIGHLRRMTDQRGLIEHSTLSTPNLAEGYTTDDNARAYIVAISLGGQLADLRSHYLQFLGQAATESGFHNDMNQAGEWVDQPGVGEWYGRAMLAVAQGTRSGKSEEQATCRQIWRLGQSLIPQANSPRVEAQLIAALAETGDKTAVDSVAKSLLARLETHHEADWDWFEQGLFYDNARLPWGLLKAYQVTGRVAYLQGAQTALEFLYRAYWDAQNHCFSFIGNLGWWVRGQDKAYFDQQPLEAGSMIEACALAFHITGEAKYQAWAQTAWAWYEGRNIIHQSLVDPDGGGICDGIQNGHLNRNQGAEAVLSYLTAGIALR